MAESVQAVVWEQEGACGGGWVTKKGEVFNRARHGYKISCESEPLVQVSKDVRVWVSVISFSAFRYVVVILFLWCFQYFWGYSKSFLGLYIMVLPIVWEDIW